MYLLQTGNAIYGSHIVIAISKVDTVFPKDDWLKIQNQIERDLGSSAPKVLGICSLPGHETGIEELKDAISRGLEDSQKAFLFNLILRSKSKDCASIIRETMLKVAFLAASGIPIHEIPKFDEEIIPGLPR
jgi:GTPase Era involved in 16S rRNA processing